MQGKYEKLKRLLHDVKKKRVLYETRAEMMNAYLVPQKDFHPRHRAWITYLYLLGFALLAVPTLEVFGKVLIQAARSVLAWITV